MAKIIDAYFWLLKVLIALFLAIMVVLVFGNVSCGMPSTPA